MRLSAVIAVLSFVLFLLVVEVITGCLVIQGTYSVRLKALL